MPAAVNITGQRFGRLVAIRPTNKRASGKVVWFCKCDCGKSCFRASTTLRQNRKCQSCGCRTTNYRHGFTPKHKPNHPLYQTWANLRNRCDNQNNKQYKWYGGRGIKYDPRWKDFPTFLSDVGKRPRGLTLDRIDNDKGYFKKNLRWAPISIQNNNRRPPEQWDRKRRRLDQFTIYELKDEIRRRLKSSLIPSQS